MKLSQVDGNNSNQLFELVDDCVTILLFFISIQLYGISFCVQFLCSLFWFKQNRNNKNRNWAKIVYTFGTALSVKRAKSRRLCVAFYLQSDWHTHMESSISSPYLGVDSISWLNSMINYSFIYMLHETLRIIILLSR